jgi:hypothetical protein
VHGAARPRAGFQGQGRGHRGARQAASLGERQLHLAARDPADPLRARAIQRKISRRALFARDGWRCAYCGTTNGRLTLDHVVPRSKGGESIWENVVTACAPCNLRKGDRTIEQAGMVLHTSPRAPAPTLFIKLAAPRIPSGWTPYLPATA